MKDGIVLERYGHANGGLLDNLCFDGEGGEGGDEGDDCDCDSSDEE